MTAVFKQILFHPSHIDGEEQHLVVVMETGVDG
jgi:hypothetical protein